MNDLSLPESILNVVAGKPYTVDSTGKSGSRILLFPDSVLKITPYSPENEAAVIMMRWLKGKLPVPEVLLWENSQESQYLLMSRTGGSMACSRFFMEHPQKLLPLLAEALNMLWSVDISDCPGCQGLDADLSKARERVEHHLICPDPTETDTFADGAFSGPEALLKWLENSRPGYDPVFSHGDFCLPNIFLNPDSVCGFIDLNNAGTGDRWKDIALCWRSLKHNADGTYGKFYPGIHPDDLFPALGIPPDREKLRYYILLDELF